MIYCDDRIGSAHLAPILLDLGHPVELLRLDFGDVAFAGLGAGGSCVQCGIEVKRLPDLLGSFASGRFNNHQLPGMTEAYDSVTLLVEGRYRAGNSGVLESAKEVASGEGRTLCIWSDAGFGMRRWMYRELEGRLTTLSIKAGIRIGRTANPNETARYIGALYDWWTGSEYAEHRSHEASFLKAQMPLLRPPTLKERVAAQLPHVGNTKAQMIAGAFESVREMVNADAAKWCSLPGVGKKVAQDIVSACGGVEP